MLAAACEPCFVVSFGPAPQAVLLEWIPMGVRRAERDAEDMVSGRPDGR